MTLTERIAYAAKLCTRMRAEYHGLIAAQQGGNPPRFSSDPDEQESFMRGFEEGRTIVEKGEGA